MLYVHRKMNPESAASVPTQEMTKRQMEVNRVRLRMETRCWMKDAR